MSSKAFHTRESGIMTALLAEAGGEVWSWSLRSLPTLSHSALPSPSHVAVFIGASPGAIMDPECYGTLRYLCFTCLFILSLPVRLSFLLGWKIGFLNQIQLIESESSAFKLIWLILVLVFSERYLITFIEV